MSAVTGPGSCWSSYWAVLVPFEEDAHLRTEWHPTERFGPFAVLSRGAFASESLAVEWARKHLGPEGHYTCKLIEET